MKKQQYILVALLVSVFMVTIYFAVVNYHDTKATVLESVEHDTDELLNNFTAEVERFSKERVADIELMAEHTPYLMKNGEEIVAFLSEQTNNMPYFTGLAFITLEGETHISNGNQFPVQPKDAVERAFQGETSFSDVFLLHQDNTQKVTALSVPVKDGDGEIVGAILGVVNLDHLVGELTQESSLPGTVYLLKDHELLYNSKADISFEQTIPHSKDFLREVDENRVGDWAEETNDRRFIKYKHTWNDWVVVTDSNSNKQTAKIRQSLILNVSLAAGAGLILCLIYIYLYRAQEREALHIQQDLLTGLGNRARMEKNFTKRRLQHVELLFTLYFIKLDRFPSLTERLGYSASDRILYIFGKRLDDLQGKVNAYRIGNEEFAVTVQYGSEEKQYQFFTNLEKTMHAPIHVNQDEPILVTASVGVRTFSLQEELDMILQDAIFASIEANKGGGHQFVYFSEKLAKESWYQRKLASNLAKALENEEFYLVYQPIYDIGTDKIVSFEALMRWKSPSLGEIGPCHFIPLLEESDAIVEVGRWLIKQVANQVQAWERQGYKRFYVTLNVSVKQIQSGTLIEDVEAILKETGVNPNRLVFEVTESIIANNIDMAIKILDRLNQLGIKTAIDDFGTGYSSLSLLKNLPFQYMKLDRTFVMEMLSDEGASKAILKGLIEIADNIHLTTIIEGVETVDQLNVLHQLGAERIQGYYFSKPIPPEKAIKFLDAKQLSDKMRKYYQEITL